MLAPDEGKKSGWWWERRQCHHWCNFEEACQTQGIAHFIWDKLLPSRWDQNLLVFDCGNSGCSGSIRITYDLLGNDIVSCLHMVGLDPENDSLQMMWEGTLHSEAEKRWFDFKYLKGRNVTGLMKPVVLERENLRQLFALYRERTGESSFP